MLNRFDEDEDGAEYELSSSDDEYTEKERELLKKAYKGKDKASDSEVSFFLVCSNL